MQTPGVSTIRESIIIDRADLFHDSRKDQRRVLNEVHACDHPGPNARGGYLIAGHGPSYIDYGYPKCVGRDENLNSLGACRDAMMLHRLLLARTQHALPAATAPATNVRLSRMLYMPSADPTNIPANLPHDAGSRWDEWDDVRRYMEFDDAGDDLDQDAVIADVVSTCKPLMPQPPQAGDERPQILAGEPSARRLVDGTLGLYQEMARVVGLLRAALPGQRYVQPTVPSALTLSGVTPRLSTPLYPQRCWTVPPGADRQAIIAADREYVGYDYGCVVGMMLPPIGHRFGRHPVAEYAAAVADRLSVAATVAHPQFQLHPFPCPMSEAFSALRHSSVVVAVSRAALQEGRITRIPGYVAGDGSNLIPCFFNVARSDGCEGLLLELDHCPDCHASPAGFPFERPTCKCSWRCRVEGFRSSTTARRMGMAYVVVDSILDVFAPANIDEPTDRVERVHLKVLGADRESMRWHRETFEYSVTGDSVFSHLLRWNSMSPPCVVWDPESAVLAKAAVDGPMLRTLYSLLAAGVLHLDASVVCVQRTYITAARIVELPAFGYALGYGDAVSTSTAAAAAWASFLGTQDHAVDAVWRILLLYGDELLWEEFRSFLQGMGRPLPQGRIPSLAELSARAATDGVSRIVENLDLPLVAVDDLPLWDY